MHPSNVRSVLSDNKTTLVALGVAAATVYVGYAMAKSAGQNRVVDRPHDDMPVRTHKGQPVAGRTVTINRPRDELFAFCADASNLSQFMQSIRQVTVEGEVAAWEILGPLGHSVTLRTTITDRGENEFVAWKSTQDSDVQASGRISFRDAPAGRGTEVEAEITYHPPLGEVGRWLGKIFHTDPIVQGRRELRRFKMLMETGEIATNQNRKTQA